MSDKFAVTTTLSSSTLLENVETNRSIATGFPESDINEF